MAGRPAATERFVTSLLERGSLPPDDWKPGQVPYLIDVRTGMGLPKKGGCVNYIVVQIWTRGRVAPKIKIKCKLHIWMVPQKLPTAVPEETSGAGSERMAVDDPSALNHAMFEAVEEKKEKKKTEAPPPTGAPTEPIVVEEEEAEPVAGPSNTR